MPKIFKKIQPTPQPNASSNREHEIEELAAPIIELILEQIPAFHADATGQKLEKFLHEHSTGNPDADNTVRRFAEYSLALRRGRRGA